MMRTMRCGRRGIYGLFPYFVLEGTSMATISIASSLKLNQWKNWSCPSSKTRLVQLKPRNCTPIQQVQRQQVNAGIMCEPCNGTGWLLCDFCKGQKTNVKAENKRIYRRCPSCRAVGYILCSKCKVFKCVTFPNYDDGEQLAF